MIKNYLYLPVVEKNADLRYINCYEQKGKSCFDEAPAPEEKA